MTPQEAVNVIRAKVTLPEGVSARIDPKQPDGVMVGTLDVMFFLGGSTLAYDEDFLLHVVNQSLKNLQAALEEQEKVKADRAAQAAAVKDKQTKRTR